jgi:hypothetical protein
MGAFLALRAKNRAFRSNSSDLLMQILWDFRFNPLRMAIPKKQNGKTTPQLIAYN